jgi:hypothetical protein
MLVHASKSFSGLGRTRCATSAVESRHSRGRVFRKGRPVLLGNTHDRMREVAQQGPVAPVDDHREEKE